MHYNQRLTNLDKIIDKRQRELDKALEEQQKANKFWGKKGTVGDQYGRKNNSVKNLNNHGVDDARKALNEAELAKQKLIKEYKPK